MCQQKSILLLPRSLNLRSYPPLGPPGRQLPVPESLPSSNKDDHQEYIMEEGNILPLNQIIPPSITEQPSLQHFAGEDKRNEYIPPVWKTKSDQNSSRCFGMQDGQLLQPVNSSRQRPVSDVGLDLHNRWKHKNENGKGVIANRSLPEQNMSLRVSFNFLVYPIIIQEMYHSLLVIQITTFKL